jgi:hypothetical protein
MVATVYDVRFASNRSFPQELRAMFLHAVSCSSEYCETPDDYIVNGVPVLFFKTYVGAAAKVCVCWLQWYMSYTR